MKISKRFIDATVTSEAIRNAMKRFDLFLLTGFIRCCAVVVVSLLLLLFSNSNLDHSLVDCSYQYKNKAVLKPNDLRLR